MGISGTFSAMAATRQPMAAKPAPAGRHGQMTQPDNNWSAPPAVTGGGYSDPQPVEPQMTGRGLVMDLGHQWGHGATHAVRNARRPFTSGAGLRGRADAYAIEKGAAQDAAAAAHADSTSGYYQGHMYDPQPVQFAGSAYTVTPNNVRAIPSFSARTVIHGRPGGQHVDGTGGEFAPTGFPTGEGGRWAVAHYSSPALGAMYSRNSLRGVLPQKVSVPVNTPALVGNAGQNSGIGSNARFLPVAFTRPQLFRSPPSQSDAMIAAAAPVSEVGPVMGVGF
jgi:hypothetical protein